DNRICISFSDNGNGIPNDLIGRLGEPFYTTKEKGTGLGLMVCYKIIEEHGGRINIKSEMNQGTTVDIIFPISIDE
ncbi:ATP-binding protein, partial [Priestia megaterium]